MTSQLDELRRLAACAQNRQTQTGIPRVAMVQGRIPEHALSAVYEPMINLILRGGKSMTVGGSTLHYDPATYFVMTVELPAVGQVHAAADGSPYLAVALNLDAGVIGRLLDDMQGDDLCRGAASRPVAAFSVATVTPQLMDAWVRMLSLMERPRDIPALAPVYEREILYRVLQGPHGQLLRDIATPETALGRVRKAIQWIRQHYAAPLRIGTLAKLAAMSESAFHRHFKAATALSPLQYQKQLRLLQARQLLTAQGASVTAAAMEVGYESATQFSREYARAFGLPPSQDAARILAAFRANAS
ncbi:MULTISPECIES: AraC family transcriptional regulator [Pseudoxanthomonas]|uniref:AraC-like DNA-binding protein n=1 Tax=Pseudoxanthomonas winnipegensis TaxID=2480810 RepID=A0AAW8G7C5_9GAMM|nr:MULTISPECIES: AraC family transcriptional regulator [Pseudoxanthomonas]MDQ1118048.1 AraC-like DNA-binding protein [Pseudoxanthomonas winnipegensis]MDQ1135018.1 AraC-like DNA-binding protein [Pseudoxanthomonas winnipegensis]MDR6138749.1 AraC-like DNA-binding protein [Pseudoxanthomonas sp. SORGH_AS_0997]